MHLWQKMQNPQLSAVCESKAKSFYLKRMFCLCDLSVQPSSLKFTKCVKICRINLDFSISSEAKCSFDSKIDQNISNMLYLMHICNFWSVQWFMNRFSLSILSKVQFSRQNAAGAGGAAAAPLDLDRSVNPKGDQIMSSKLQLVKRWPLCLWDTAVQSLISKQQWVTGFHCVCAVL